MKLRSSAFAIALLAATSARGQDSAPASAPASGPALTPAKQSAPPEPPRQLRIAIYPLQPRDVSERVAQICSASLVAELRKLEGISAIGMDEIEAMLTHEQNKQLLGCDEDSCLAEIGGALGVDELVTGGVGRIGDSSVLSLRRTELQTARVLRDVEQRLTPQEGEEFLAALGPAVEQLYPDRALRPGAQRGVEEEVALRLRPPPLPTWIFYSTLGLGVLTGAASVGATVMAGLSYADANALAQESVAPGQPLDNSALRSQLEAARTWDSVRVGLYAGAAILFVGLGIEALFTDWQGYAEGES